MSVLDLSGADTSGFDAIPSGTYLCRIEKAEMGETRGGPEAKLPAGTPKLNVQFVVDEGEHEGRYLFGNYTIPPADYINAKKLQGMLVNFLVSAGYDEKKVTGGKFNLDPSDLPGRKLKVIAQKKKDRDGNDTNNVRGTKPLGEDDSSGLI